jgi:hypothetical protein
MILLIAIPLMFGLVDATLAAADDVVPSELRDVANQMSFLAAIARRCNTRLEVLGRDGLRSEPCLDFLRKWHEVYADWNRVEDIARAAARAADASSSQEVKWRWDFFWGQFKRDLDDVEKTMGHLKFLAR